MLRSDASAHAEWRESEPRGNPRVSRGERGNRVEGWWTVGGVRVDGASPGGAVIRPAGQKGTRGDASLGGENDGTEHVANDLLDPGVPGHRECARKAVPAARVSRAVQGCRCYAAGGTGPGARTVERAGNAQHSAASLREIRRAGISAAVEDFRGALIQPAQQDALPQTGCRVGADATGGGVDRGTAQAGPARPARFPAGGRGGGV